MFFRMLLENEFTVFLMVGNLVLCVDFNLLKCAGDFERKIIKPIDVVTRKAITQKAVILRELSMIEGNRKARKVARQ